MTSKEYDFIVLFEKFIKDSYKGKRLKPDGNKIKSQTVDNYNYVLIYLQEYQIKYLTVLRIRVFNGNNKRIFLQERNYWKKFYFHFTDFLYTQKGCFDNYVGNVIKIIRIFFNYLNRELGINTGDFYKDFYICREEVPIVTLMPDQLQLLINDRQFEERLSKSLLKSKAIFVFGCTVGLRVSDLFSLKFSDIEKVQGAKGLDRNFNGNI